MTIDAQEVVARARALVGSRFRPQGRDPATGLDCVGLVLRAFEIPADKVRQNYRLRGPHKLELEHQLAIRFRRVRAEARCAGDVLLCAVLPDVMHLAVQCAGSFIHADSRLRRIVETPGAPPWPIVAAFRSPTAGVN